MALPRIFASGVYGSDYDVWSAWSFTDRGTRNRLALTIGPDDYCLAVGMMKRDTPAHERGRLISLIKVYPELVSTPDFVHPNKWRQSLKDYGERWMYALPIRSVERFSPPPLRADVLPRIASRNLYRVVGRHYVELTPDEVKRVLTFPRVDEPDIYRPASTTFTRRTSGKRRGPKPSPRSRQLSPRSGPAATYRLELVGPACAHVIKPLRLTHNFKVMKIGFSRDPERRLEQINAFLPCQESLRWRLADQYWHKDEINAWAMEQEIFDIFEELKRYPLKGEIICCSDDEVQRIWASAARTAQRPTKPVYVPLDE